MFKQIHLLYFIAIYLSIMLLSIGLSSCGSTSGAKKTVIEKPSWIDSRPVSSQYYYGIGSALKKGSPDRYRNDARENALSEMAGMINTQISSNVVMYKVEDRFGVREMLQNRIKTKTSEFLEGYEFMDQWEDETRYFNIYKLSKTIYEQNKELRKKTATTGAFMKYQQAINQMHAKNYMMAYTLFAQTLEGIKDYLHEGVVVTSEQGYQIDLGGSSLSYLDEILQNFRIFANPEKINVSGEEPDENIIFTITDSQKKPIGEVPIKFDYTGGYLVKDTGKSNNEGIVESPEFKSPAQSRREAITASIDVQALARMATFDLDIRRMLEKWNSASCRVQIEFIR